MDEKEVQLMIESTKLLRDMCEANHEYTSTINKELQKLLGVISSIEARVSKLEAK